MKEYDIRPAELFDQLLAYIREDITEFFNDTSVFLPSPCPACGVDEPTDGFEKFNFRYVLCGHCGSLYVSPRPPADLFFHFHAHSKSNQFFSSNFYKETAKARREKIYRPRANLVAEFARRNKTEINTHLVDIGSGFGLFLEEVQKTGAFRYVSGIEPNHDLAEDSRRRGFRIIEKQMESITPAELKPSFITSFEVIEHLLHPNDFLSAIYKVLQPGGLVLVTTLTISGFDLQVLWDHSKIIVPPQHLNFLSVRGMELLFKRIGYDVIELETPGELDVDIVRNALLANKDLSVSRFSRTIAMADEETRRDFQTFLKTHRLSSHIRCLARKPREV